MTYNALDNINMADNLKQQIILEIADLEATLEYEEATSTRYDPDDPDNPETNYTIEPDRELYEFLTSMHKLVKAIDEYRKDRRT